MLFYSAAASAAALLFFHDRPSPVQALLEAGGDVSIQSERRGADGVTFYRLTGADSVPLCPGADGTIGEAVLLDGTWRDDGSWQQGGFSVACRGGALAKCVENGFRPWENRGAHNLHLACVRMVRADYCGDGKSTTRAGIAIRFQTGTAYRPGPATEAGWSPSGAVVVFSPRTEEGRAHIAAHCPDRLLRGAPWPDALIWNE